MELFFGLYSLLVVGALFLMIPFALVAGAIKIVDSLSDKGDAPVPSKERPRPIARIGRGVGRCAYCHSDVAMDDRVACAACLAVHHAECYGADDRCAACRSGVVLVAAAEKEARRRNVRESVLSRAFSR